MSDLSKSKYIVSMQKWNYQKHRKLKLKKRKIIQSENPSNFSVSSFVKFMLLTLS